MDKFKNEKGAALVLTLFIVTLILLFVLTQFYQITNTAKQVSTMEKNIDAKHMAEMGVEYYYRYIMKEAEENGAISDISSFVNNIPLPPLMPIGEEGNRSFKITESYLEDGNIIHFTVIGSSFGKEVIEESTITLTEE